MARLECTLWTTLEPCAQCTSPITRTTIRVTRTFRERRPELVSLARRLELVQHVSAPLDEVLARIWEELAGYQSG